VEIIVPIKALMNLKTNALIILIVSVANKFLSLSLSPILCYYDS